MKWIAATALIVVVTALSAQQHIFDKHLEKSLRDREYFESKDWAKRFRLGEVSVPVFASMLQSKDDAVVVNAQHALFLLADSKGLELVQKFQDEHRNEHLVVPFGPFPVPLTDWDYKAMERDLFKKPVSEWHGGWVLAYGEALGIDRTSRGASLREQLINKLSGMTQYEPLIESLRKNAGLVQGCGLVPKEFVQQNAFFMERHDLQVSQVARQRNGVTLMRVSTLMGQGYSVVVEMKDGCWVFKSIYEDWVS